MNLCMWNAPKNEIPTTDICSEHMRILEDAVLDADEFDVRTPEVYEALDYLQKLSNRTWGFTLYREGLERPDLNMMREGFMFIQQHLGEMKKKRR